MDAKIDILWARYNKNDQSDCFHFLKLSCFHRVDDLYSFWTISGISKGVFILVLLLHTGEKPYKCIRVVLFSQTKLILKPIFIFFKMYPCVKKSPFSESDVKLKIKSTRKSIFRSKVFH